MRIATSIMLATFLSAGTLYADKPEHAGKGKKEKQSKHKENKKQKKHEKKERHKYENGHAFSADEQGAVKEYYKTLPPGLAQKLQRGGELPAGWQKKVNAGQKIPQEYLQYAKPVSYKLQSQLSVGPVGSELLQIADKVIRIETGTNMILDAIEF